MSAELFNETPKPMKGKNTMNTDTEIKIVPKNSFIYNAKEALGFETGEMGKGKPKAACIYSVYSIGTEIAQWQCVNAWGQVLEGSTPVKNLVPYKVESEAN